MRQTTCDFGRSVLFLIIAGASLVAPTAGQAQNSYPERPIRLIVPFPPGGQADNVSRHLSTKITPHFGHQLVVDNRGGAAGTLGAGEAARAKPDGYTLVLATSSTHAINPTAMANVSYDPVKDFAAITVLGTGPIAFSVHPSVPARTLRQMVTDAKAHPGKYSYGSSGIASINNLAGELLKIRAGNLEMLHVPYKGAGPAMAELIGGQIPSTCSTLSAALPHHRAGRVRTLVVMKEQRSESAPDIPTTAEGGVPNAIAYTYNILLAPAGTPQGVVDYLSGTVAKVMADKAFVDVLVKIGVDPITDSNPDKAAEMIRAELAKWGPLIASLGLRH